MKENEYFMHIYHDLTVNNTGIIHQENIHPIHVLQFYKPGGAVPAW